MALFDEKNRNVMIAVMAGFVAAGIAKKVAPAFAGIGRPLAKAMIKSGLAIYETGREKLAQFGEVVEDLVAEVKAERDVQSGHRAVEAGPVPPGPDGGSVQ